MEAGARRSSPSSTNPERFLRVLPLDDDSFGTLRDIVRKVHKPGANTAGGDIVHDAHERPREEVAFTEGREVTQRGPLEVIHRSDRNFVVLRAARGEIAAECAHLSAFFRDETGAGEVVHDVVGKIDPARVINHAPARASPRDRSFGNCSALINTTEVEVQCVSPAWIRPSSCYRVVDRSRFVGAAEVEEERVFDH